MGQYYHEYIGDYKGTYGPGSPVNRFWPVLGNHDTDTDQGRPYHDYFTLPGNERYYIVEEGPVKLFMLNSVPWFEPDGVFTDSVQALWLRDQLAASPDTWNLVLFHHAPYSSGYKGGSSWMRWPFKEWGAHVTVTGHNHTYERILIDGFTHFVNGVGGGARYAFDDVIMPEAQFIYNANHGAMRVEVTPTMLLFQFFNRDNVLIDSYTMEKSG
ncbi:MAG: alkaline phosphatase [Chloroflexaceae bacterium]|nr:alkaline phosphatase [Chloroflexaceae bacterium]